MSFGQHIRHLRLTRRMTVDDLAADTDLRLGHLLDLETDRTAPSVEDIEMLAAALEVPEEGLAKKAPRVRADVL